MKLMNCLSMLLLAIISPFRFRAEREEVCNVAGPFPNPTGVATVVLEANFPAKYLLAARGTGSQSAILCTASLAPVGVLIDDGVVGERLACAMLGAFPGTVSMVASKAIAENVNVYATAAGKITDAVVPGAFWVGKTAPGSSAAADNDVVEVIPRFPRVNP